MKLSVFDISRSMNVQIELEREQDGRWFGEVPDLPGVMAYGGTCEEAIARVNALALRVLADRFEHGEEVPHRN
jgi:predicted RNase H-like HicB family nuclease